MAPVDLDKLEPHPECRPDDWSFEDYNDCVPKVPRGEVEQGIGYIRGYVKEEDLPAIRVAGDKKLKNAFDDDERGITPLHYQTALGHPEMVKFLIGETPDLVFRRTWRTDGRPEGSKLFRNRALRTNHHPKGQLAYEIAMKQGWSQCAKMLKEAMLNTPVPGPEFWKLEYMPKFDE